MEASARLVLNYKGIPYRTEWIEHPQITSKFKELSVNSAFPSVTHQANPIASDITPHTGPGSPYTVPVIQLADGTHVMDSAAIASTLESVYPEPSIHLETGLHEKFGPTFGKIGGPLVPVFMPRIARDKLLESSVPWFQEARKKAFGMSLDELEQVKGGEQAWAAAQPGFKELISFLTDHKQDEGPFVLGSQVSYVDFVIVSMAEAFRRIGDDLFEKFVAQDERLRELHQACQKWMKDDQ